MKHGVHWRQLSIRDTFCNSCPVTSVYHRAVQAQPVESMQERLNLCSSLVEASITKQTHCEGPTKKKLCLCRNKRATMSRGQYRTDSGAGFLYSLLPCIAWLVVPLLSAWHSFRCTEILDWVGKYAIPSRCAAVAMTISCVETQTDALTS